MMNVCFKTKHDKSGHDLTYSCFIYVCLYKCFIYKWKCLFIASAVIFQEELWVSELPTGWGHVFCSCNISCLWKIRVCWKWRKTSYRWRVEIGVQGNPSPRSQGLLHQIKPWRGYWHWQRSNRRNIAVSVAY